MGKCIVYSAKVDDKGGCYTMSWVIATASCSEEEDMVVFLLLRKKERKKERKKTHQKTNEGCSPECQYCPPA